MIYKYSLRTLFSVTTLLLISSCLRSSDSDLDYSPDAQIYDFSISSKGDTTGILNNTTFTIDQINGEIFNKEPLPYQFHIDSVVLNIKNVSSYISFHSVSVKLLPDTTYLWKYYDSIPVSRLDQIITIAANGENSKEYNFKLNIYQQDPYILSWNKITENYLQPPIDEQKTFALNNQFFTYYRSGDIIKVMYAPNGEGTYWDKKEISGLPTSVQLSSITTSNGYAFILDSDNRAFRSSDGSSWEQIICDYPLLAIYGILPTAGQSNILALVDSANGLKFAEIDDFPDVRLLGDAPENIPFKDFSAATVNDPDSYSIKYIIISGGVAVDKSENNNIWILKNNNGTIERLFANWPSSVELSGSRLFFYDNKPYMMLTPSDKNSLYFSNNFGLDWEKAEDNHSFPKDFHNRTEATVISDNNNFVWIFGGVSEEKTQIVDVWKGKLNKFLMN